VTIPRWGLPVLAGICLLSLLVVDLRHFPLGEASEIRLKLVLMVAALLVILQRDLFPARLRPGQAGALLGVAATVAALAYVNFGTFHGRSFIHHWEQFHYVLGAKYFPELGYDGLYVASVEAQAERTPTNYRGELQETIRDLRSNRSVSTGAADTRRHAEAVKARFSPQRWVQFVDDNDYFLRANSPHYVEEIRRDHGFNPPPSWTFVARLFAWPAVNAVTLNWLAGLDLLLVAAMFAVVFTTFGARAGCLALIVFGLNYAGRYYWVGGAFLRETWLFCSVVGVCLVKREHYVLAGALIGWAAADRLFPALFMFGPALLGLRALLRREPLGIYWQLAGGFVLALGMAFALGSLTGRGMGAWADFITAISLHQGTWLTNNVGLENVVLTTAEAWRRELVDFGLPDPWIHADARLTLLEEQRHWAILAARLGLMLLIARVCWRSRLEHATIIGGLGAIFALLLTTCYYWQMLLLVPLLGDRRILYAVLLLNIAMAILHFFTPAFEFRYGVLSWGLLLMLLTYLLPRLWQQRPCPREIN